MLTPVVYQARLGQEANLIRRYQAAIDQQQKLLTVYMECLTSYLYLWESYTPTDLDEPLKSERGKTRLSSDGTTVTFRTLIDRQSKVYQDRIIQCAQGLIEDYKDFLSNRMTVFVEDAFIIHPQSQVLIHQALAHFSNALYNPLVTHYQSFVFPQTEALLRDCLAQTQADFLAIQQQFDSCLAAQPVVVEQIDCFQSDTQKKMELLKAQYLELLPSDLTSMIYAWCSSGDSQALAQHLQANNESPFHYSAYLKHHAPEALHRACAANQLIMVKQLLNDGVKPIPDRYAYPPIHYAALSVHENTIPILEALYQQDPQMIVHTGPRRQFPLHTAAASGNVYAVMWLLHRAASINVQDAEGNTPLHCAALYDQAVIVRLLYSKKALFLYNHHQLTPPLMAIRWERHEALKAFDEIQLSMVERIALVNSYAAHRLSRNSRSRIESVASALSPAGQVLPNSTSDHIMQAMLICAETDKDSDNAGQFLTPKKPTLLFGFPWFRQKNRLGMKEISQAPTELESIKIKSNNSLL